MTINVLIQGGLGNQLFQLAWANYLKNGIHLGVQLNTYLLHQQQQHDSVSSQKLLGNYLFNNVTSCKMLLFDNSIMSKIIRKLLRTWKMHSVLNQLLFDYDAQTKFNYCCRKSKVTYHYGYFQFVDAALFSRKLFISYIEKQHPLFKEKYSKKHTKYIGIHIRRGDFVDSNNTLHKVTQIEYIKNAMRVYNKKYFLVFSDDIDWCREKLTLINGVSFFKGNDAIEDFIGLMYCHDFILSGSTFSWWAAILNADNNTRVVISKNNAQFLSSVSNKKIGWKIEQL